jgi:hypothetical protein
MEPKNSLEALENLIHCKSETKCRECHHKNVCTLERDYNIVKQDLIQKEQDIQDVITDYQDAARLMFKYMKVIELLNKVSSFEDDFTCGYAEYCNRYGDNDLTEEEYNLVSQGVSECIS